MYISVRFTIVKINLIFINNIVFINRFPIIVIYLLMNFNFEKFADLFLLNLRIVHFQFFV